MRLYVDGVFDMFHFGHARYILQAKNMFPDCWVIAGGQLVTYAAHSRHIRSIYAAASAYRRLEQGTLELQVLQLD